MRKEQNENPYPIEIKADHTNDRAIKECLTKILISPQFQSAPRMRTFIEYIVTESLCGRSDRLKEYNIAVDVFGREEGVDIIGDSLVRTSANRLRNMLDAFNSAQGEHYGLYIVIPKGTYVPKFYRKIGPCDNEQSVEGLIQPQGKENSEEKSDLEEFLNAAENAANGGGGDKGVSNREMMAILLAGGIGAGVLLISYISIILIALN